MPKKICGLGFDCVSMMLQPGLEPGECLNYATCGSASELTPDEEIELIRMQEIEYGLRQETIRTTRRQAAVLMLMSRGCPQTVESLGVTGQMQAIAGIVEQLQQQLNNIEGHYIAPPGCEVHTYSVKRPSGTYYYNKLTASEAIFEPSSQQEKVKVIHLSHSYDPRTEQAKLGIERRNQLTRVRTLLSSAVELLEEAANTFTQHSTVEDSSPLMTMDSTVSTDEASETSVVGNEDELNLGETPILRGENNTSSNYSLQRLETRG